MLTRMAPRAKKNHCMGKYTAEKMLIKVIVHGRLALATKIARALRRLPLDGEAKVGALFGVH